MDIVKREAVKKAYPGKAWSDKVDKMTESQIVALYFRLKSKNKI